MNQRPWHRLWQNVLTGTLLWCAMLTASAANLPDLVFDHVNYNPNERLQAFYDALPEDLQKQIGAYREQAKEIEKEVERYNEMPRMGLTPDSFKVAQRRRMKIESQMAALRLEQKNIAKHYYDLRATGWSPPNNSNIVRLLVANVPETEEEAAKKGAFPPERATSS